MIELIPVGSRLYKDPVILVEASFYSGLGRGLISSSLPASLSGHSRHICVNSIQELFIVSVELILLFFKVFPGGKNKLFTITVFSY